MPPEWSGLLAAPALIVAAHQDDEVIGTGSLLPCFSDPRIVHVTDGAPRNEADAHAAGCGSREHYARLRRAELLSALQLAGIDGARALELCFIDQEAMLHLADIAVRVAELVRQYRPACVFTHPYEGGHPDHDATAFAVHAACSMVDDPPTIIEFTSYHGAEGAMVTGQFLPNGGEITEISLTDSARQLKRKMFDCYATQQHMLIHFDIAAERFRAAPGYDFTRPPHGGMLLYERFGWASGERFRALASEALQRLAIHQPI